MGCDFDGSYIKPKLSKGLYTLPKALFITQHLKLLAGATVEITNSIHGNYNHSPTYLIESYVNNYLVVKSDWLNEEKLI